MKDPFIDEPSSFSDFQTDLNSFYKNNFEKVIKRKVVENRKDEIDMRNHPATSAHYLRLEKRTDTRRGPVLSRQGLVSLPGNNLRTTEQLNIKTSGLENKGMEIGRSNLKQENSFSNMKTESLYDWYEYLKQSGRFKLGD